MSSSLVQASGRQPDLALVVWRLSRWRGPGWKSLTNSQTEDDFPYEQDIQRNPGSTKPWLAYIEYKLQHGTVREQAFVMERACVQLPRSYKLWKMVSPGRAPGPRRG
jgi:pre-mRNA-splicing factor SYF1